MQRLRMCVLLAALLLPASQASAQGAQSSLNVFLTFLLDPGVTMSLHDTFIWETGQGRARATVQQPIVLQEGPPPTLEHNLASSTPRGGRGYARARSFLRFANHTLEPASVTIEWTAHVFIEAIAGHQTQSSATSFLAFGSLGRAFSERVSSIRSAPPQSMDEILTGQLTFFLPAGELRSNGTIRPATRSREVLSQAGMYSITTVPEPISMVLLGTGLAAVGLVRRRRRTQD